MNLTRLRLVTFDVTNTLLSFRIHPAYKYAEVAASYKIVCDSTHVLNNFKNSWRHMNKNHPNFGRYSGLGWEQWWKNLIIDTFHDAQFPKNKEIALEKLSTQLLDIYRSFKSWRHCVGVQSFLSYLRHKKIVLGVISNFDPRLHEILRSAKLDHYFKFIISSYEIGMHKPDPKIFFEAMKMSEIKDLKVDECLHIGNTVDTDYKGAINTDWQAALIYKGDIKELQSEYDYLNAKHIFDCMLSLHKQFVDSYKDPLIVPPNGN